MKKVENIALIYNVTGEELGEDEPPDSQAEFDSIDTINSIKEILQKNGYKVIPIEANKEGIKTLASSEVDFAFNISEGYHGRNREAHFPAILEALNIPYTGSDVLTLALCLDKGMTKKVLKASGVLTPRFQVFTTLEPLDNKMKFPLFVKPAFEGSSKGISESSVVENEKELYSKVYEILSIYKQPALVEEFVSSREFTVGILGNNNPLVLPIREINYKACPPGTRVYSRTFKVEWSDEKYFLCPAPLTSFQKKRIELTALAAYKAVGCKDVGRVDIRMDKRGIPHVIEINPLPGLCPGYSDLPLSAEALGIDYEQLILTILRNGISRYNIHEEGTRKAILA